MDAGAADRAYRQPGGSRSAAAKRPRLRPFHGEGDLGVDPGVLRPVVLHRCPGLLDALADRPGEIEAAFAAEEARPRPWADAARRMARRNVRLLTATNLFQLLAREAVLLLAARPFLAPVVKRLLKRDGERL